MRAELYLRKENIKIGTVFAMALNNPLLFRNVRNWFIDEEQGISNLVKLTVPEDLIKKFDIQGIYICNWEQMENEITKRRKALQEEFLKTNDKTLTVQSVGYENMCYVIC